MMRKKSMKWLAAGLALLMAAGLTTGSGQTLKAQASESSQGSFRVLSLNVAGLPGIISSSDPAKNTVKMSPLLNEYDLVSVQEDFAYHKQLISQVTLPYLTPTSGNVPVGDGMNFLSAFPLYETQRYKWNDSHGFITNGADQMTPKGILYSSMEIAPGYYIDIYDIHTDAGTDPGSMAARESNLKQLAELILQKSSGKAVIVIGDTNCRYTRDKIRETVLDPCGVTDIWVEYMRGGVEPVFGSDALIDEENRNSAANEVVDKIWYRSGKNVELSVDYYALKTDFTDEDGNQLSDHFPITATFRYELKENVLTTQTYGGGGGTGFSFMEAMGERMPEKIAIRTGSRVDGIAFTYQGEEVSAGGSGGTYQELTLADGEYIVSMEVCKAKKSLTSTYRISYVKFVTNLGNVLEGGKKEKEVFTFRAPEGYGLAGVHGSCDSEIDRLGAIYLRLTTP